MECAARLDGANGAAGMFGFSYVGATQLLAAVARPPSLRSIAPGFTASQYYDGWTYNGGALAAAFVCYWANLLALGSAVRAEDRAAVDALSASLGAAEGWFWWLPMSEFPPLQGGYAPYFYDWVEHCTYDDYWNLWRRARWWPRRPPRPCCTTPSTPPTSPCRCAGLPPRGERDAAPPYVS